MSHGYAGANRADRDAAGALLDKAHQYPQRGRHVGARAAEGPAIRAAWDGVGPVPLGWSSYQAHRNGDDVVWLPEPETATKLARLTPAEQGLLTAVRAQTEPHGPEENPSPVTAKANKT